MLQTIKAAESRLAELQGQILTAEQVKDIGIKKSTIRYGFDSLSGCTQFETNC